ncbi:MAG: hypothetical protein ABSH35_30980 [Isosphaeraceae bacterium]|jgi:hypothetical protein
MDREWVSHFAHRWWPGIVGLITLVGLLAQGQKWLDWAYNGAIVGLTKVNPLCVVQEFYKIEVQEFYKIEARHGWHDDTSWKVGAAIISNSRPAIFALKTRWF